MPDIETAELDRRLERLEERLERLESVLRVSSDGLSGTLRANTLEIHAEATLLMRCLGTTDVEGAMVRLNGGGQPLARMGDPVTAGNLAGVITNGSNTVLG